MVNGPKQQRVIDLCKEKGFVTQDQCFNIWLTREAIINNLRQMVCNGDLVVDAGIYRLKGD